MSATHYPPHQFHPDWSAPVLVLTLPATPFTPEQLSALEETLCTIEDDHADALLVLASTADGAPGLDYQAFGSGAEAGPQQYARAEKVWRHWDKLPNAKIAFLSGSVCAFAATLALACDVCFMHDKASLAWNEGQHGLTAGIAAWLLPPIVGMGRARELLLTGRQLPSALAVQWGLANATYSATDLSAAAGSDLGRAFASVAPAARKATRQLLRETWGKTYENAIGICLAAQASCLSAQKR